MNGKHETGQSKNSREDRLRAALRANLAKRKAQARARTDQRADAQTDMEHSQAEPDDQITGKPEGDE
ncbi:hypothetical protein [Paracoccus zhejiangensis]|uniref:Uncharacterized protein n=1 Tax=Paracoccus zhejiangensis TaxID=1077935 RepID=A0A2H5EXI7_9RHOB|nr:hypothetical protein [Paracoccus zhejiangensis]AUH63994.1 hypothetical protein CX676_07305 [Paracoccus zhejiangensis]